MSSLVPLVSCVGPVPSVLCVGTVQMVASTEWVQWDASAGQALTAALSEQVWSAVSVDRWMREFSPRVHYRH